MMTPTDQDLTDRFERLEVDATTFGHRDHVAAGYGMLRRYSFVQATARYAEVLREMTVRVGAQEKFNTTITVAFMALIAERMESSRHEDFEDFSRQHPDLLSSNVLNRFYSPQRLTSRLARRVFVMPDAIV